MALVIAVGLVVFVVAAVAIGREARTLAARQHRPTYRLPDALAYVAERLDAHHAAQIGYDELAELLRRHIDLLQDQAVRGVGATAPVVTDDPGVVAVAQAADAVGLDVPLETIMAVMSRHLDYLRALGALEVIDGT